MSGWDGWLVGVHELFVIIDLWMSMLGHCELSQYCCTCVVHLFGCCVVLHCVKPFVCLQMLRAVLCGVVDVQGRLVGYC